jgi:uncharacterized protein (TIRG00374 family)
MYKRLFITFVVFFLAALAIGTGVSLLLFRHFHIQPWDSHALIVLPILILLTFVGLLFRFWRWHYILRHADVRLPTRLSMGIYLAGFSQTIIPLFIGEIALKTILIRRHSDTPLSKTILIVAYERLLDLMTLAFLTIPYLIGHHYRNPILSVFLSFFTIAVALSLLMPQIRQALWTILTKMMEKAVKWLVPDHGDATSEFPISITSTGVTATAMVFSLGSWLVVASILPIATMFFGGHISWLQGIGIFGISTIAGGVSLSPGSVGITGFAMAQTLIQNGVSPSFAGLTALTTRLSTFGVVFALGVIFLGIYYWKYGKGIGDRKKASINYETEFADEAREYYVEKKAQYIEESLHADQPAVEKSLVLDIGCGPGWYLPLIGDSRSIVIGIDSSISQLRLARKNVPNSTLLSGDICDFPLKCDQFDVAYAINVFHHLPSAEAQRQAFEEIYRILKPDGVLMLHEMNVTNPLFRFYLGYVLPLFNKVDQGTEFWIRPKNLESSTLFTLRHTEYFTFLPDFLPGWLLHILRGPEQLLEHSPIRKLSAHFMAVLQK